MDDRERLEKMDLLRARFNITYNEARETLEACGWDPVEAAVRLEQSRQGRRHKVVEELKVTGADLVETIKRLLHEGNINRIVIRDAAGAELLNLPVNGLVAVTVLIPVLTAIGAVVVLAMDYTVQVEREVD
jgi:hypothetical protein